MIIFYLFSIFFIFMNYIQLFRDKKLEFNKHNNTSNISKLDVFYYLSKVLYWIWVPIGMLTYQSDLFILLFMFGGLGFIIYHISKKIFIVYNKIFYPIICMIILLIILFNI